MLKLCNSTSSGIQSARSQSSIRNVVAAKVLVQLALQIQHLQIHSSFSKHVRKFIIIILFCKGNLMCKASVWAGETRFSSSLSLSSETLGLSLTPTAPLLCQYYCHYCVAQRKKAIQNGFSIIVLEMFALVFFKNCSSRPGLSWGLN